MHLRLFVLVVFVLMLSCLPGVHGAEPPILFFGRAVLHEDDALYATWMGSSDVVQVKEDFAVFVGDEALGENDLRDRLGKTVKVLVSFEDTPADGKRNPLGVEYRAVFAKDIPVVRLPWPIVAVHPEELTKLGPPVAVLPQREGGPPPKLTLCRMMDGGMIEYRNSQLGIAWETRVVVCQPEGKPRTDATTFRIPKLVVEQRIRDLPSSHYQLFRMRDRTDSAEANRILAQTRLLIHCEVDRPLELFYSEYLASDALILYTRPPRYRGTLEPDGTVRYFERRRGHDSDEWGSYVEHPFLPPVAVEVLLPETPDTEASPASP